MVAATWRWTRRGLFAVLLVLVTVFVVRAWDSQRGDPLEPWHTYVPRELGIAELDATDWAGWMAAEAEIFRSLDAEVTRRIPEDERVPENRFFEASPVNPERFARNWNRSFVMEPVGELRGAVVMLHGLTDSPFSLRHLAHLYRDAGFAVYAIRLPGHGTVPAGLTDATWEDWMAATRLAFREARRRAGAGRPLHAVGYSNGGALAMKYALDAQGDTSLPRPDRIVLMSPMIGVTAFARVAGLAALPAYFPAFAKAAWLSVLPEFNPFKYNSFPVNAARQSHRLTQALQQAVRERSRAGILEGLAPVLTFQSVMDFTVSTSAVLSALYAHLPANGSEIVLFDINRTAKFGPLLRQTSQYVIGRILPPAPRAFRTTVVTNASEAEAEVVARIVPAGAREETVEPLGLAYPREVFSLSHVAIPFPVHDGLYGTSPDPTDAFGVQLGALAARGEVGVLIINLDTLMRMSANPFFPYLASRVNEGLSLSAR